MKRTILAFGIAIALLLSASGCGGLSKDEQKASKSISKVFAGSEPSKARVKVADCFSDKLVSEAGIKQLKADKVIDKQLKAATTVPQKLSKKTAEAYGDGLVQCFDFKKLKADIKKDSGATDKQVDAYVKCLDGIDDSDLKQAIVDDYTKSKKTATSKKVNGKTAECGKKLGS